MRITAVFVLTLALAPGLSGSAFASRASQEGRALPRLLSEDVSLARFLPGVLSGQDRFMLVDVANTSSQSDLGLGLREGSDDLAMALVGNRVRFGYVLDGSTHNLVMTGRGGWGLILGVSDGFNRRRTEVADTSRAYASGSEAEASRRVARLGGGWSFGPPAGRRVSVGVGVTYLDVDYTLDYGAVRGFDSDSYHAAWHSSPGLGFDLTFQTVSPSPGLQLGGQLRLEDMHPESTISAVIPERRRYAALQAGWRVDTRQVDDLVIGVLSSWEIQTNLDMYEGGYARVYAYETTTYLGGVFFSAEQQVLDHLRLRGGVLGTARFRDDKRTTTYVEPGGVNGADSETSTGEVDSPQFALGGSWTWKTWLLEAQITKSLSVTSPVVRWSATLAF